MDVVRYEAHDVGLALEALARYVHNYGTQGL